jgi:hypothetical protein
MDGESLLKSILKGAAKLDSDQIAEAYLHIREVFDETEMERGGVEVPPIITGSMMLPEVEKLRLLRASGELEGISTGYPRIDKRSGGWREGELIVIAAASRVGKTKFAQNVCHNMAMRDIPSCFLNLEMGDIRAYDRIITMNDSPSVGGSPSDASFMPIYSMPRDWNRPKLIEAFLGHYTQNPPYIKVFVIDHLTNLPRLHENVRDSHRMWCVFFRDIALRYNIVVVILHHFRKMMGENAEPTMYDLADSQQIHDLSDQVYLLSRNVADPVDFRYLTIRLDKSRNGGELGSDVLEQDEYHKLTEVDGRRSRSILKEAEDIFKNVTI